MLGRGRGRKVGGACGVWCVCVCEQREGGVVGKGWVGWGVPQLQANS